MPSVDFYFDYLSPFAYLAARAVPAVCERHGAGPRFRPILFAGLLNHWGQLGPAEIPPKGLYAFRTCLRYAIGHSIPFRMPKYHPFNPLTALRATLAADSEDGRRQATAALFELGWARGGDLGDAAEITAALDDAGLDGAALVARGGTEAVKAALKEETSTAIARGVFGIPTMLVGEELFWGLDQLEYLDLFLSGKDPLAGVDFAALMPKGLAAWRKRPT